MEESRLVVKLPKELKTELNLISIKKGTTMTNIVNDLVKNYVEENK